MWRDYPAVNVVHCFSDGPCAQYRQKGNFYMFSTELFKRGFQKGTWSFFKAGHGKGAPDGVRGILKRTADRLVSEEKDIPNAWQLYESWCYSCSTLRRRLWTKLRRGCPNNSQWFLPLCTYIKWPLKLQERSELTVIQVWCSARPLRYHWRATMDCGWIDGQWCVIKYDDDWKPGTIVEVNETHAKVTCMHKVGKIASIGQTVRMLCGIPLMMSSDSYHLRYTFHQSSKI